MGYRIYVTDLAGEVRSLLLALLRIKEEQNALQLGEPELLARLKALPAEAAPRHRGRASTNGGRASGGAE